MLRERLEARRHPLDLCAQLLAVAAYLLRLDDDLSGFYAAIADDPDLAWAAADARRPDGTLDRPRWEAARDGFRSFVVED